MWLRFYFYILAIDYFWTIMLKIILFPLSILFGIVVYFRNRFYDFNIIKSVEFDLPVISVGNITVGGTGKTPHTEYLVGLLKDTFKVATLSRGYKRKSKGFKIVEANSTAIEVGDEPLQIKRKFSDITVSVCNSRVEGVTNLINEKPENIPDVVLLDDAYQHRRITPGLNILLIDFNRPIKEDTLLPAGRLREGPAQIRRANIIIITKCPAEVTPIMERIMQKNVGLKPYQSIYFTTMVYNPIKPVFQIANPIQLKENDASIFILLVTGIASTIGINNEIGKYSSNIEKLEFGDHHIYTSEDIEAIKNKFNKIHSEKKIIITTEKDSMRLKDMEGISDELKKAFYFLPVKIKFLGKQGTLFNQKITNYVRENKSNSELYKRKNQH